MSALTTPSKYPYPVGTDQVRDGDNIIAALAAWLQDGPGDMTLTRSGNQTMGAGWTKLTWSTASYASPNAAAQSILSNTNGVSVPAGRYQCSARVTFPIDGGGARREIGIFNAAQSQPGADDPVSQFGAPASNTPYILSTGGIVTMAAPGIIAVGIYTNGAAQAVDGTTFRLNVRRTT